MLPPFVSWIVNFVDEATRRDYLDGYAARLRTLETTAPMFFHPLSDFGADWRLKPDVEPRAAGQNNRLRT